VDFRYAIFLWGENVVFAGGFTENGVLGVVFCW
jgi:hypothetical protein